jgi:serine/threonine protein kinase
LTEPDDPLIGTIVADRYRVLALMGRGSTSRVYRALQLSTDRETALKIVARADGDEGVARFEREAKAMARLRSPYAALLYDAGPLDHDRWFMAIELVRGESLDRVLARDGPFSPARAEQIIVELSFALEDAHRLGIVHRDLKPANVMIEEHDGKKTAKLIDFGLVKALDPALQEANLSVAGCMYGTPAYMAPEQWTDELGPIGPATDVYGLGQIFYEMLTGSRVFTSKGASKLMRDHLEERPPRLSSPPHSAKQSAVIDRCLLKNPSDRYPSMAALRAELEAQEKKPPAPKKRQPLVFVSGAALLLLVIGVFAIPSVEHEDAPAEPIAIVAPIETSTLSDPPKVSAPRLSPPRINGDLGSKRDRAVIAEIEEQARACLGKTPLPAGARLYLVATASGKIDASVERGTGEATPFVECLERTVRNYSLRPGQSRFVTVTWDVVRDPEVHDSK